MRRHVRSSHHNDNEFEPTLNAFYQDTSGSDLLQMDYLPHNSGKAHKFENTLEARVEVGETLQALALRFHCTVADIKRLNKIDKDNEIYARKVVKIPVTVHSVLFSNNLPTVHTSGNNSPKHGMDDPSRSNLDPKAHPINEASTVLSEKLLVASVNASSTTTNINQIILNSKLVPPGATPTNDNNVHVDQDDGNAPLLSGMLDDDTIPQIRPIRGPSVRAIDWSGSDCDMSWVCLFIFILALCFVIPLVYVIYLAEHSHHQNHTLQ